jgi:hypothetical protein
MFVVDYGKWLELVDERDTTRWVAYDDLDSLDMTNIKLVTCFESGEKFGACWVTMSDISEVVTGCFNVVEDTEEMGVAIREALTHSNKCGGSLVSVGCLLTTPPTMEK